jgi:hypothetical protein
MTRDLVADCGNCAALCCFAHSFDRSDDFAFSKGANERCVHLTRRHRCAIHDQLTERGFRGCAMYTCYGAGQRVTSMFAGTNVDDAVILETFRILRAVHELMSVMRDPALRNELAAIERPTWSDVCRYRRKLRALVVLE